MPNKRVARRPVWFINNRTTVDIRYRRIKRMDAGTRREGENPRLLLLLHPPAPPRCSHRRFFGRAKSNLNISPSNVCFQQSKHAKFPPLGGNLFPRVRARPPPPRSYADVCGCTTTGRTARNKNLLLRKTARRGEGRGKSALVQLTRPH